MHVGKTGLIVIKRWTSIGYLELFGLGQDVEMGGPCPETERSFLINFFIRYSYFFLYTVFLYSAAETVSIVLRKKILGFNIAS